MMEAKFGVSDMKCPVLGIPKGKSTVCRDVYSLGYNANASRLLVSGISLLKKGDLILLKNIPLVSLFVSDGDAA